VTQAEAPFELVMTQAGVAGFDATTEATLAALRAASPELRIRPRDLGGDAGVVYNAYRGRERLLYVVPDDAPGWTDDDGTEHQYAKTIFAVFAVSDKVRVDGRAWRVGTPLADISGLDACECWGNRDVTSCWGARDHVRVVFDVACGDADTQGPRAMLGMKVSRLMWKRVLDGFDATREE